ncbi:hypothetical protein CYMTET_8551 [Cymbomonas tetramitiformis]|uniref:Uncharacterized protein n=1 Tax=Cymbomonas tetramitiformis TaxID=36881 RepID=A0AAE0LFR5_9CHLO|nr:hypothetical protein CYMTET_8551 [Cymbomonas tetramitiformis]
MDYLEALGTADMLKNKPTASQATGSTQPTTSHAVTGVQSMTSEATSDNQLDMMMVHGDYLVPSTRPEALKNLGGTEVSPVNGLFNGSNILTFQGHPEFLPEAVNVCFDKLSDRGILPKRLPPGVDEAKVRQSVKLSVDADWLARTCWKFFTQK